MSITHSIVPYDEQFESEFFLTWFEKEVPHNVRYGRLPSWGKIKSTLEYIASDGHIITYDLPTNPKRATIVSCNEGDWLLEVEILNQNPLDSTIGSYSFRGDRFFLEKLLRNLPIEYGTFLVMSNGEDPELITAERIQHN